MAKYITFGGGDYSDYSDGDDGFCGAFMEVKRTWNEMQGNDSVIAQDNAEVLKRNARYGALDLAGTLGLRELEEITNTIMNEARERNREFDKCCELITEIYKGDLKILNLTTDFISLTVNSSLNDTKIGQIKDLLDTRDRKRENVLRIIDTIKEGLSHDWRTNPDSRDLDEFNENLGEMDVMRYFLMILPIPTKIYCKTVINLQLTGKDPKYFETNIRRKFDGLHGELNDSFVKSVLKKVQRTFIRPFDNNIFIKYYYHFTGLIKSLEELITKYNDWKQTFSIKLEGKHQRYITEMVGPFTWLSGYMISEKFSENQMEVITKQIDKSIQIEKHIHKNLGEQYGETELAIEKARILAERAEREKKVEKMMKYRKTIIEYMQERAEPHEGNSQNGAASTKARV